MPVLRNSLPLARLDLISGPTVLETPPAAASKGFRYISHPTPRDVYGTVSLGKLGIWREGAGDE